MHPAIRLKLTTLLKACFFERGQAAPKHQKLESGCFAAGTEAAKRSLNYHRGEKLRSVQQPLSLSLRFACDFHLRYCCGALTLFVKV
jgi:hypothetical protein